MEEGRSIHSVSAISGAVAQGVPNPLTDVIAAEVLWQRWQGLGPDVGVLVEAGDGAAKQRPLIALNEDLVLEMGSVFKVFLLAAFARFVEQGEASCEQPFRITASDRIPHSAVLERLPDGHEITARDLLVAMMGQSDNTATQMLVDVLPPGAVDEVIRLAGLASTTVAATSVPSMPERLSSRISSRMLAGQRSPIWSGFTDSRCGAVCFAIQGSR